MTDVPVAGTRYPGTRYHRLARETPWYRWWRLPAATGLALLTYVLLAVVLMTAATIVVALVTGSIDAVDGVMDEVGGSSIMATPWVFVVNLASIIVLLPAVIAGTFVAYRFHVGYLTGVTGHLRWSWLARTSAIAFAVFTVALGLSAWLAPDPDADPRFDSTALVLLVLTVLLVPLQAAAEEYVFRGLLLQLFGSWFRWPAVALIGPTAVFTLGHDYNIWGMIDVATFGVAMAVITVRTGGLEAAISIHAANNVVLLSLESLGVLSTATGKDAGGPADLAVTVVLMVGLIAVFEWQVRRVRLTTTRPAIAAPSGAPPMVPVMAGPGPTAAAVAAVNPPIGSSGHVPDAAPDYPGTITPGWYR